MPFRTDMHRRALAALPALALLAAAPAAAQTQLAVADTGQVSGAPVDERPRGLVTVDELIVDRLRRLGIDNPDPAPREPTSRADSARWNRQRDAAWGARGKRIIVSVYERRLWLVDGQDTLLAASAGVGMGVARRGGRSYDFSTPTGVRRVLAKQENPLWVPPDWHYYGKARRVRQFPAGGVPLADGTRVVRRGNEIGIQSAAGFEAIHPETPLQFEGTLYIPPFGTVNRQIPEVLGAYKIDTGDGYLIHGTNDPITVGFPATHGCIRLGEEELARLYEHTTIGMQVYIY